MKSITRKTMLYKTGVEYGDYTMNHVLGCSHGCLFPCYAFMLKKRFGVVKTYEGWCEPRIVSNTLELLDREIPRLKSKIKSVHLCFSTDPFMLGCDEVSAMSLAAISKLNAAGIKCTVLTKGLLPAELAELSPDNEYGITLVSLDEEFRRKFEPHTSTYQDRIAALKRLHDAGCKTWVSVEPYPPPSLIEQSLGEILESVKFADKIIFGRLNYNKAANGYGRWYGDAADAVKEFCRNNGIDCHIKAGTYDADAGD